jgi:hypothetical protein
MDELLGALVAILLGNLLLVPLVLSLAALFPRRLMHTRALSDTMPGRAFTVGLVNFLFFGAVALGFSALADALRIEPIRLPALIIVGVLTIALSFGLTAVAQLIGNRLRPQDSDLRRTVWGALALSLGCTFPFVGWFALLPYTGLLGLGAFILSFFVRQQTAEGGQ